MSGIDLANQYRENKAKIEAIWADYEKFAEVKDAESREVGREYRDKIWALQDEERNKERAIAQAKEERRAMASAEAAELNKVIDQVVRIIYFLKLQSDLGWKEGELKAYEGKELVRLGALHQDEYLDMRLYIVENDRPKNRYTLFVYGRCAFDSEIWSWDGVHLQVLELPRDYSTHVMDYGVGENVRAVLAHLPTVEDVKQYCSKRSNELMRDFLVKYRAVKRDYLETLRIYRLEEFSGIKA